MSDSSEILGDTLVRLCRLAGTNARYHTQKAEELEEALGDATEGSDEFRRTVVQLVDHRKRALEYGTQLAQMVLAAAAIDAKQTS